MPRNAKEGPLTPRRAKNSLGFEESRVECALCLKMFKIKKGTYVLPRFCSPRCRQLYWWAAQLVKAYREGKADGLKHITDAFAKNCGRAEKLTFEFADLNKKVMR